MLKKRILLLLTVCLMLQWTFACALEHDFAGAFRIRSPDTWELDENFGLDSSTEDFKVLGAFETYTSLIEISISDDRAYYEDFSVPTQMNSEYYGYLAELMGMLERADDTLSCEYVKGVGNDQGNALFLIFYVDDGAGGYYYADTMLGGCTLLFYAYSDQALLDTGARQLAELETLLKSITFNDELF